MLGLWCYGSVFRSGPLFLPGLLDRRANRYGLFGGFPGPGPGTVIALSVGGSGVVPGGGSALLLVTCWQQGEAAGECNEQAKVVFQSAADHVSNGTGSVARMPS